MLLLSQSDRTIIIAIFISCKTAVYDILALLASVPEVSFTSFQPVRNLKQVTLIWMRVTNKKISASDFTL